LGNAEASKGRKYVCGGSGTTLPLSLFFKGLSEEEGRKTRCREERSPAGRRGAFGYAGGGRKSEKKRTEKKVRLGRSTLVLF